MDLMLRGPRPDAGLGPLAQIVAQKAPRRRAEAMAGWWAQVEAALGPLLNTCETESAPFTTLLDALVTCGEALCGEGLWGQSDGRALSMFVDGLRGAAENADMPLPPRDLPAVLRDAMDRVSVRPPWGGHPRVAIYGLLEARMGRADLVICAGLTEGRGPPRPSPIPCCRPPCCASWACQGPIFALVWPRMTLPPVSARPRWC
jgi:ATP-dependent helicase/nuclease subunit B